MLIRPAKETDLPHIAALHLSNWRHDYRDQLPATLLGDPLDAKMGRAWASLPGQRSLVRVAEGRSGLLGFCLIHLDDPEGPLLESLHIAATARGQGVGRALMAHAARDLLAQGFEGMWLCVFADNGSARAVYARMGGREGAVRDVTVLGHPVRSVPVHWSDLSALAKPS
ncbi:GNAT family N-acetyltransferase [Aestuariivita sp.]|jgi:ribosomal protein S18 acetylase RimI-like enzyme|uniref:GNAT family N-acetyltransferase n=1 Tax=Aestuariivita sp. TaxID=1872407 RepID=UPI00216E1442|nr:GNAT family N-acetyltransferase [Aestuariivita sp.]MCE8006732.1 GNAT family N-acetyltransferase [Aestuariivita sp.]